MREYVEKMAKDHAGEVTGAVSMDFIWAHSEYKWNWCQVANRCTMGEYMEHFDLFLEQPKLEYYGPIIEWDIQFDLEKFEAYLPLLELYKLHKISVPHLSFIITSEIYHKYRDWPTDGWHSARVAYEDWCAKDLDESSDTGFEPDCRVNVSLKEALRHPWRDWDYTEILAQDIETNDFDFVLENLDFMQANGREPYMLCGQPLYENEIMTNWSCIADIEDILSHPELKWDYEQVYMRKDFDFERHYLRLPTKTQADNLGSLVDYLR